MAVPPETKAPECAAGVDFLGFSDAPDKRTFEGTGGGGLSALTYDARRGVYYGLVDNGPVASSEARFYILRLVLPRVCTKRDSVVAANHLVPILMDGADPGTLDEACRAVEAELEPEIARAQKLQRQEARGQGNARSESWRFRFAKRGARLLGRYRWAQNAWLKRQHDLRFGSTEVKLRVSLPERPGRRPG